MLAAHRAGEFSLTHASQMTNCMTYRINLGWLGAKLQLDIQMRGPFCAVGTWRDKSCHHFPADGKRESEFGSRWRVQRTRFGFFGAFGLTDEGLTISAMNVPAT